MRLLRVSGVLLPRVGCAMMSTRFPLRQGMMTRVKVMNPGEALPTRQTRLLTEAILHSHPLIILSLLLMRLLLL